MTHIQNTPGTVTSGTKGQSQSISESPEKPSVGTSKTIQTNGVEINSNINQTEIKIMNQDSVLGPNQDPEKQPSAAMPNISLAQLSLPLGQSEGKVLPLSTVDSQQSDPDAIPVEVVAENKVLPTDAPLGRDVTKLTEYDWVELTVKSGIAPEIANKNFKSVSNRKEIAKLLGWADYPNSQQGFICKSVDPETGNLSRTCQFKPRTPHVFEDGREAKYLTSKPTKKSENDGDYTKAIYPITTPEGCQALAKKHNLTFTLENTREDLGLYLFIKKHPEIPILITEGAKKACALLSNGHVAIAITGVWNGQKPKKESRIIALIEDVTSPSAPPKR